MLYLVDYLFTCFLSLFHHFIFERDISDVPALLALSLKYWDYKDVQPHLAAFFFYFVRTHSLKCIQLVSNGFPESLNHKDQQVHFFLG